MNLLWSKGCEGDGTILVPEGVLVGVAVMSHPPIELPRPPQKYMPRVHWCHVTEHRVLIAANPKTDKDLFVDTYLFTIIKPLKLVRTRVVCRGKSKLLHYSNAGYVRTTPSIDDNTEHLLTNMAPGVKDVFTLLLIISYNLCVHSSSRDQHELCWCLNFLVWLFSGTLLIFLFIVGNHLSGRKNRHAPLIRALICEVTNSLALEALDITISLKWRLRFLLSTGTRIRCGWGRGSAWLGYVPSWFETALLVSVEGLLPCRLFWESVSPHATPRLELLLNLDGQVNQILHLDIMLQLHLVRYVRVQPVDKSGHGRLAIFLYVCSDHGNLHFPVVLVNTASALPQTLKLLVELSVIVARHESLPHDGPHLIPSLYRLLSSPLPTRHQLIPPNNSIISEFSGSKYYLLAFGVVVAIEHKLGFGLPFKVGVRVTFPLECWNLLLDATNSSVFSVPSSMSSFEHSLVSSSSPIILLFKIILHLIFCLLPRLSSSSSVGSLLAFLHSLNTFS